MRCDNLARLHLATCCLLYSGLLHAVLKLNELLEEDLELEMLIYKESCLLLLDKEEDRL